LRPSKKTTTTPNRSITYTRSWWAKQAFLFSLLVLFFSCEEELNTLGFKSNQQRFKVFYAEIPIESSVLWMDSVQTLNLSLPNETNRILVGSYSDPELGEIKAESYAQIRPNNVTLEIVPTAVFDSAVLQLYYDFYTYGSAGVTDLNFSIHEITEPLTDSLYFSNSTISFDPISLGNQTSVINAEFFNQEATDTDADTVLTAKIKLDQSYGQRLFDAIDREDENYTNFSLFKTKFKGLAIIPQQSDKVVGLSTSNVNTALILYYHDGDTKSTAFFSLGRGVSFSKISSERSGTELAGLNQYYTDFQPPTNRFIQGGSLVTKLDFSKYYELIDPFSNVIINSAELSIENVNQDGLTNHADLTLGMLTDNNRFKVVKNSNDKIFQNFEGFLSPGAFLDGDLPLSIFASNDQGNLLALSYSKTDSSYGGAYPTMLFQKLFEQRDIKYKYWALTPINPAFGKSVTRTILSKDNIKLKIYYTLPFIEPNE